MSCDDSFDVEKPGAIKLENGLWTYPQHLKSQEIIDAQCFWLKQAGIEVSDYSSGREYTYASYIENEEAFKKFFIDEDE